MDGAAASGLDHGGYSGPEVAIVGAGIGGLAAAAFLADAGIRATVHEQAPALTEVGAGLVMAPNAVRALRRLGEVDRFLVRAVPLEIGWEFRRWDNGAVLSSERLADSCVRLYGEHTYTVHRADLLRALQWAVPPSALRLGHRCVGFDVRGGRPELTFLDGGKAYPDVVVGADGVHSVIRRALVDTTPPRYSGLCAFRALVPAADAPEFALRRAQTLWIGPDHHLVHYPVAAGDMVNLVAFAPAGDYETESWTASATVEEFLAEFQGWDRRLTELISSSGSIGRWALLDRTPLERWSHGPATLLGDAAHPMFPFFAQGAAQAIEDAAVLARCLAADPHRPAAALRRYEDLRIERTTRIQTVSHARAHVNHLHDGPEQEARDRAFTDADPLVANGWIYGYDAAAAPETGSGRRST